ncbi:pirin family protein [Kineobactrum sediminis]|uniref:Pirin family protein n=1 Tax=Kineobactrum sediminis TaxID=1905677 RepID=A0A2N5Y0D5_9GAMM|nr:pirin family protein [Kineobactrum sediminis]PLW81861.1 pirin family protein [Kineobactrum sediminis]
MSKRIIQEVIIARASRDGDGVAIERVAGMQHGAMDPILMLDELRAARREDLGGGFPAHPHRGMQTLTYMKHGGIIHQDNRGHRGEIRDGGVQWMSAGRGIIHSEMPTQDTQGLHGFQLWINLPAAEKMHEPRYRDIPKEELVTLSGEGFQATAIAGDWQLPGAAVTGPLHELAPRAGVLDLHLEPGREVTLVLPASESLLAYIYEGTTVNGVRELAARHLLVTSRGDEWTVRAGSEGASLLLLRGEPLREPVVQYGPFVMNTSAEIDQAIKDFRNGDFG